jgi:hypothetical protein
MVYLWEAGGAGRRSLGISDDCTAAQQVAGECLRSGDATGAHVEEAITVTGVRTLNHTYELTGNRWAARFGKDGRIQWKPLPAGKRFATSTEENDGHHDRL